MLTEEQLSQIADMTPPTGAWKFAESVPSSVTTAWGVSWSEELTARDLLQNFRDANKTSLEAIRTAARKRCVSVFGPAEFNLKRLYFLGSEKSADAGDIGAYGEGFKAACLALLRDFNAIPVVISGGQAVHVRVGEPVQGTELRPLIYDYYQIATPIVGTWMVILGCTAVLESELLKGIEHFLWDGHPALGKPILRTKRLDIFKSKGNTGLGFYRGLRRLVIPKVPFVFALHSVDRALETKTKQDRDRKGFAETVAAAFYKAVVRDLSSDTIIELLAGTKPLWEGGHPLLAELAKVAETWYSDSADEYLEQARAVYGALFPPEKYFAKEQYRHLSAEVLDADRKLRESGRVELPNYFMAFGVASASLTLKVQQERHVESVRKAENTTPSRAERACIDVLNRAIEVLEGNEIAAILNARGFKYLVAHTEEVLGMLRVDRGFRSSEVVLAHGLFEMKFSRAVSTLLHEYAHVFGGDGSRAFTDALTHIIERVIEKRDSIEPLEREWDAVRGAVLIERRSGDFDIRSRLLATSLEGLQSLIARAPDEVLQSLEGGTPLKAVSTDLDLNEGWGQVDPGSVTHQVLEQLMSSLEHLADVPLNRGLCFGNDGRLRVEGESDQPYTGRGSQEKVRYVMLSDDTYDVVRMDPEHAEPVSIAGLSYFVGTDGQLALSEANSRPLQVVAEHDDGLHSVIAALVMSRILAETRVHIELRDASFDFVGLKYVRPGVFVADIEPIQHA